MDVPEERNHTDSSLVGKPTALLFCRCPVAAVSPGMPPVWLYHWHTVLSRCALAEEGGVPLSFHPSRVYQPPAMARGMWYHPGSHQRGSGRSAQFSTRSLYTKSKLKEPLNVVG